MAGAILLALAMLQAAPPATQTTATVAQPERTPHGGERFSILVDTPPCPSGKASNEVVVCGREGESQQPRLPLPDERGPPEGPAPSNPELSGSGALAAEGTPCAAHMGGCQVGFGPPVMPILAGAVRGVKSLLAKHPDKSQRVPIPLGDPVPADVSDRVH